MYSVYIHLYIFGMLKVKALGNELEKDLFQSVKKKLIIIRQVHYMLCYVYKMFIQQMWGVYIF